MECCLHSPFMGDPGDLQVEKEREMMRRVTNICIAWRGQIYSPVRVQQVWSIGVCVSSFIAGPLELPAFISRPHSNLGRLLGQISASKWTISKPWPRRSGSEEGPPLHSGTCWGTWWVWELRLSLAKLLTTCFHFYSQIIWTVESIFQFLITACEYSKDRYWTPRILYSVFADCSFSFQISLVWGRLVFREGITGEIFYRIPRCVTQPTQSPPDLCNSIGPLLFYFQNQVSSCSSENYLLFATSSRSTWINVLSSTPPPFIQIATNIVFQI